MNKKDFPIKVLELLQPYYTKTSNHFKCDFAKSDSILFFKDIEEDSKFFFNIISFSKNVSGKFLYQIAYCPTSVNNVGETKSQIESSSLETIFNSWVGFLERYSTLKAPNEYDDPILNQYEDDFYTEFELVDDDANTKSFSTDQQIAIDSCLDYIIKQLSEARNEQNQTEIDDVVAECVDLKQNQTKLTKKQVVKKFAKIFAKAKKGSIYLLKIVRDEIVKEFAKQLIKGTSDYLHILP